MSYVERAIEYAKAAQGSDTHGKWSQLACKRFLNDLKRAKKKDCTFYFSEDWAVYACEFVETLHHVEGTWDSPTITLHDSMVFFYVNLYGFRNRETGKRRFTTAVWASGRKNAKSTGLGAPIGLFSQFEEDEEGAQVVSAATTGDQAKIVWGVAKRMVEKNKDFREHHNAQPYARTIAGFNNGSVFKYISAKASTQDGLNPSCAIIDEVHAHPNHDLINVLKSAAGARSNPLFLFVTTEGYAKGDTPWPELRMYSHQILSGAVEADHVLTIIFSIDDDDDEFDEKVWIKANPLIEVNPILFEEIKKEAKEAMSMPSKMAEFRIKRLNRPSAAAEAHIDLAKFQQNKTVMSLDELEPYPCWMALDLSATRDLTTIRMLWDVDGQYHTHGWRFLPKNGIHQQTASGGDVYSGWKEQGLIIETPGETVNQAVIKDKIVELYDRFQPIAVGSDPWNARELIRILNDDYNIDCQEIRQGAQTYHPAIKKCDEAYYSGDLYHGCDPILVWCAGNLVMRYDQNMNQAPDKKNSANKIDDMAALYMCFHLSLEYEPRTSFDDILRNKITVNL
ncbi:MAG: terminase large subunit [Ignavibacteriaceae bacterium]|nr:terminase large subunit [Ignavibacteriaceae bacterium]